MARVGRFPPILLAAGLLSLLGPPPARGGDQPAIAPEGPTGNTSYVRDDAPWLRKALADADEAEAAEDWRRFVRALQEVVERRADPDVPRAAAPDVVSVWGTVVYEGAWRVAHHRILAAGEPALDAYRAEFGAVAEALLQRGLERRRAEDLRETVDRFLPLEAGRRAALLLADLALEAGEPDEALEWLERLEDLVEVTAEPAERRTLWVDAWARRTAVALARPDRIPAAEAWLRRAAAPGAPDRVRYAPLPASDRRPAPEAAGGAAQPGKASLAWWRPLPGSFVLEDEPGRQRRALPSPWFPARAAVAWPYAFVSDGAQLDVWDLRTGQRALDTGPGADATLGLGREGGYGLSSTTMERVRQERGLIEGHTVTPGPRTTDGQWLYVAAPDPYGGDTWSYADYRDDRLIAFTWDGRRLTRRWAVGGLEGEGGLEPGTRLYGAPLAYRGRLWIAGVRPSPGSDVQADAWLYALDPDTGDLVVGTWLGSGVPVRPGRPDEAIPSSPAAAAGRVVVSTSMGIVAAVDARDGRLHWSFRNDCGVAGTGRPLRLGSEIDTTPRTSGFLNRPPLVALERVWLAPTDGPWLYCLFDRPRGAERYLLSRRLHRRRDFDAFAAEQVAGLVLDAKVARPALVVVGKAASGEGRPPAPLALAVDALTFDRILWRAEATTGDGGEPYGEAELLGADLYVPTAHGITAYRVGGDGSESVGIDRSRVPAGLQSLLPPGAPLFGNVLLVPGHGLLAVNGMLGTWWSTDQR